MDPNDTGSHGNDESGHLNPPSGDSVGAGVPPDVWQCVLQGMLQAQDQNKQLMQMLMERRQPTDRSEEVVRPGGVKDFKSLHPPEFNGSGNPIAAKEWLDHVYNLLVAANVPDAVKASVVQIQLTGIARAWYDNLVLSFNGRMTWDQFKTEFCEEYFPSDAQDRLLQRFLYLRQGTRFVDEYAYEYNQLSKSATAILPTDAVKVQRFVQGLRNEVK